MNNHIVNLDVTDVKDNMPLVSQSVLDGMVDLIKDELTKKNFVKLNYHYLDGITINLVFLKSVEEFESYLQEMN